MERSVDELVGHLGDGAEVEDDDERLTLRPLLDEEVPRVRVGVEVAVDEELLVEGLHEARREPGAIEPHAVDLVEAGDLHPLHEGHGEDVGRGPLVHDGRKEDVRLVGEVLRHALDARGFVQVVGLAPQEVDERTVAPSPGSSAETSGEAPGWQS